MAEQLSADLYFPCLPMRPGRCGRCDVPLPSNRRRWCSDACADLARASHHGGAAAARALRLNADCPQGPHCVKCERPRYRSDEGERCGPLEVNHITPLDGRKRSWTCENHPDNLEVVCHDCHVGITRAQAVGRPARRKAAFDAFLADLERQADAEDAAAL